MIDSGPGVTGSSSCGCLSLTIPGIVALLTTLIASDCGGIPPLVVGLLLGGEGTLITPVINSSLGEPLPPGVEVIGLKGSYPLDNFI